MGESNQVKQQRTRERDLLLAPFLQEHRMRGTGWLGEQLGLKSKHVAKIMKRLNIPRRPKTGAPMDRNVFWKGGRVIDKGGYVLLKTETHPHADKHGYIREHRLVMERSLGRYLKPKEVVHHKNGQRADNRIENLELFDHNGTHMALEWTGRKHTAETRKKMSESALALWQRRRQLQAHGDTSTHLE